MPSLLLGLALVLLLSPLAVWAVRFAKRQRGGAVLLTGLLLVFGMNMQITPPLPPRSSWSNARPKTTSRRIERSGRGFC